MPTRWNGVDSLPALAFLASALCLAPSFDESFGYWSLALHPSETHQAPAIRIFKLYTLPFAFLPTS